MVFRCVWSESACARPERRKLLLKSTGCVHSTRHAQRQRDRERRRISATPPAAITHVCLARHKTHTRTSHTSHTSHMTHPDVLGPHALVKGERSIEFLHQRIDLAGESTTPQLGRRLAVRLSCSCTCRCCSCCLRMAGVRLGFDCAPTIRAANPATASSISRCKRCRVQLMR
jgi:hypothetical protein